MSDVSTVRLGTFHRFAAGAVLLLAGQFVAAAPTSEASVCWRSPSADYNGSMPLGNGEVALNAWIEPSGDLRVFLARTDAWDEYGRLLKVGGLRVRVGNGDPSRTRTFKQTLDVRDATLRAEFGEGAARVELTLWVDANRPVVVVEAASAAPTEACASLELWRTNEVAVGAECSDVLNGCKDRQAVAKPDAVLTGLRDRIGWYHRNAESVGPELCGRIQGMAGFERPDPLLHRTFGALIAAERAVRVDDRTLRSPAGTRHVFEIAVDTRCPATAEAWQESTAGVLDAARALPLAERRRAHEAWWAAFWERSWIRIAQNALPPPRPAGRGGIPSNALPLSIGLNAKGGSRFAAAFGRVGLYRAALGDAEVAALAAVAHDRAAPAHPARIHEACGETPRALPQFAGLAFAEGFTAEAWIYADDGFKGDGRLVDKTTPGGADGFLFDTYPGDSLRVVVGRTSTSQRGVLKRGVWQHVAAVIEPSG